MADYNIYSDETNIGGSRYMLIGGLWVRKENETELRDAVLQCRTAHKLGAEMKWTKVSPQKLEAYKAFVDIFFCFGQEVSFRCLLVDTSLLDYRAYHGGDKELGFYKFYFQLISRNLLPDNRYWLFTDERQNRKPNRLTTLKFTTNNWCYRKFAQRPLRAVEARRSHDEDVLQLTDVLLGSIGFEWNRVGSSEGKRLLAQYIAKQIGWPTLRLSTTRAHVKMNIWEWQPKEKTRPES